MMERLFAERQAGFLIDVEFYTPKEITQEPVYRDFWRPQGIGWAMGTAIPIPTGENASFVLTRPMERGPFERASAGRLDQLRPHLARSVLISPDNCSLKLGGDYNVFIMCYLNQVNSPSAWGDYGGAQVFITEYVQKGVSYPLDGGGPNGPGPWQYLQLDGVSEVTFTAIANNAAVQAVGLVFTQ